MRIAVVAPRDPIPIYSGLLERIYQLCRYLGRRHDVLVFFPNDPAHAPSDSGRAPTEQPFERVSLPSKTNDVIGSWIPHYSPLTGLYRLQPWLIAKLQSKLAQFNPEAIIVEMPYLFPTTYVANRGLNAPLVLSEHNVEYKMAQRLNIRFSGVLRRLERFVANRATAVVTVSDTDRETLLSDLSHDQVFVAPNGVDVSRYHTHHSDELRELRDRYDLGESKPVFVYHGQLGNAQNREAVDELVDTVFPFIATEVPVATLLIIGPNPPSVDDPNVITTGLVDDLPRHLALADAALVPLRSGSGTNLKILEYLATGIPVVTTPIGAEGLPLTHGETALIASDPEELARNALRVIEHDELRSRLSEQGRQLAVDRFSWDRTLKPYEGVLSQVTGRRQSHNQ